MTKYQRVAVITLLCVAHPARASDDSIIHPFLLDAASAWPASGAPSMTHIIARMAVMTAIIRNVGQRAACVRSWVTLTPVHSARCVNRSQVSYRTVASLEPLTPTPPSSFFSPSDAKRDRMTGHRLGGISGFCGGSCRSRRRPKGHI